jgi:hypothetical protein
MRSVALVDARYVVVKIEIWAIELPERSALSCLLR